MKKHKTCSKCGKKKLITKFYHNKSKRDGYSTQCKDCDYAATKRWIKRNPIKYKQGSMARQTAYIKAWKSIIKELYPKGPVCQICGTRKKWPWNSKGRWINTICFDHRRSNSPIKTIPASWLRRRFPSPKNIKIFVKCDFGLLCRDCNSRLPTKRRKRWLKNIIKYCEK